jgi:transposase
MAVAITRTDLSARELRAAASKTGDAKAARRMLALALVLEGVDRKTAAETCGMDRQTLRDWVHRYNADGLEGLPDRRSAGPSPRLSPDQKAELAQIVREGPDLETDGVVRWRRVDLKRKIEARFGVVMHERTVGKQLADLGFRRLSVRPQHPKSNPDAQETFKKTSRRR